MKYRVTLEGEERDVEVEAIDGGWRCRVDDGEWRDLKGRWHGPDLRLDGRTFGTHIDGDRVSMQLDGTALSAIAVDPRKARNALGGGAAEGEIRSPMPGVVVRIPASVGDEVTAGQVLIVVEAMKMENEFKAPVDGVVASIEVEVGQALESNALLISLD